MTQPLVTWRSWVPELLLATQQDRHSKCRQASQPARRHGGVHPGRAQPAQEQGQGIQGVSGLRLSCCWLCLMYSLRRPAGSLASAMRICYGTQVTSLLPSFLQGTAGAAVQGAAGEAAGRAVSVQGLVCCTLQSLFLVCVMSVVLLCNMLARHKCGNFFLASSCQVQLAGSGDRSERIRTYNFPQGRVTDHRVGHTEHGLERVLAGEALDVFSEALQTQHTNDRLMSLGTD